MDFGPITVPVTRPWMFFANDTPKVRLTKGNMKKRKGSWKISLRRMHLKGKEKTMKTNDSFRLKITGIDKVCAAGEEFGRNRQIVLE